MIKYINRKLIKSVNDFAIIALDVILLKIEVEKNTIALIPENY